ncbi:hypothetical protein [Plantactinospora sp. GCM10030261]|uniref:hypothetical protein n=1 Tax=Plantactinospora sp. GCM10030261 TaxID=3273420 RepID=UPI003621138F
MEQPTEIVTEAPRAWDRPVVSVPVLVVMSFVGGSLPSFSVAANVYALGTGGALIWMGLSHRVARRPVRRVGAGVIWWVLPVAAFGVVEGVTFVLGSTDEIPTFSRLADPVLENELARSAAYFGWLSAFWALARR